MTKKSNATNAAAKTANQTAASTATPTSATDTNASKSDTPKKEEEGATSKIDVSSEKEKSDEKPVEEESSQKPKDTTTESTGDESKADPMDIDTVPNDKEKTTKDSKDKSAENTDKKTEANTEVKSEEDNNNKRECSVSNEVKSEPTPTTTNSKLPPPILTGASIAAATAVGSNATISGTPTTAGPPAHPLDEIMAMLKTGYPLLALSMETMVDQIQLKFKPQADEDMYRLVVALYNEGAQVRLKMYFYVV